SSPQAAFPSPPTIRTGATMACCGIPWRRSPQAFPTLSGKPAINPRGIPMAPGASMNSPALGFAAGNSGILTWDWDREVDFGILRSDGSAKMWQGMLSGVAQFAAKAAPYATSLIPPQVAIVMPQSLQLSVFNSMALDAQKASVRALYQYARGEAYAVGEYQTDRLGNPKLIILPSPLALDSTAW